MTGRMQRMMKRAWWLTPSERLLRWYPLLRWFVLGWLAVAIVANYSVGNLISLAVTCFMSGILLGQMTLEALLTRARALIQRQMHTIDILDEAMDAFRQEVNDGRIEIIPLQPGDKPRGTTFH